MLVMEIVPPIEAAVIAPTAGEIEGNIPMLVSSAV
jgi:hypothetical protein